jgi:hypothetical protein
MNCELFQAKLTDALSAGDQTFPPEIVSHLQLCADCKAFHEAQARLFHSLDAGLQAMVNQPVPASLLPRVRARLDETEAGRRWLPVLLPAAAVLVVACILAFPLLRRARVSNGAPVAAAPAIGRQEPGISQPEKKPLEQAAVSPAPQPKPVRSVQRKASPRSGESAPLPVVLVDPRESAGFAQLVAMIDRQPKLAKDLLHPVEPPAEVAKAIEPLEVPGLEIQSLGDIDR